MTLSIATLVVFFGEQSLSIVTADWRERTRRQLGEGPGKAIDGVIAVVLGLRLLGVSPLG